MAGEGPDFVANQRTAPGGDFPMNHHGGGLSYCHTGMYGMFPLLEAARQLRGEGGDRQVKDAKTVWSMAPEAPCPPTGTIVLAAD